MVKLRSFAGALLLIVPVFVMSSRPAHGAVNAPAGTLSGIVRDEVGRALAGVELLILAPRGGDAAILRAVSDESGRFLVSSLTPGVYRVAAIKTGYVAALSRVNTVLQGSVDLVLHPVPRPSEPGAQEVQSDLSWALRAPARSILKDVEAQSMIAALDTGGPRSEPIRLPDSLRGEVEHVVALGAWRPASNGPSSSLNGNETRMQFGGNLGQRGAIRVEGRHGSLDSGSGTAPSSSVSRAASDVDVDLSYDTGDDARLGMRAFYSRGDFEVGDTPGALGGRSRQEQRSWGYEGLWRKQVDGSSRVALQVGIHDANLDVDHGTQVTWDPAYRDASNRAIGAEGQFESLAGDGHLMRFGVRAQLLSLSAPEARIGRSSGAFALEGTTGWSLLLDAEDQWAISGPLAFTYGLSVRQGFDGPYTTAATPRVGASWAAGRFKGQAALSYVVTTDLSTSAPATPPGAPPIGYGIEVEAGVSPTVTLRGTASYVPSRATVWDGGDGQAGIQGLYVGDGSTSDRFVALALDRAAGDATVSFRVAEGRAEGALAPAFDPDEPVLLLSNRSLSYQSLRLGTEAPRVGSSLAVEYRSIRQTSEVLAPVADESLNVVELSFAQQLVRLAGGRASCRLLLNARTAIGGSVEASAAETAEGRRFAASYQRVGAGVSLAF